MILVLKVVLVPALIALVTVANRRWGPRVGGLLASMPLVAGPALFFLSVEQGTGFAAEAAHGTLAALTAVAGSAVAYAWLAQRTPWWASLPASWACFLVMTLLIQGVRPGLVPALIGAVASFLAGRAVLPAARGPRPRATARAWDLPLRMFSAMALVLVVTEMAEWLGPRLTGALTPFPVVLTILLAFTHAGQGVATAVRFLQGFLPGMWSFAVFCFVLSLALPPFGVAVGFPVALATQLAVQGAMLAWLRIQ
jgi:hypothetical protein